MNKKEALYFTDLVEILKSIPDIEISTEDDGFSIKINSHSPLEEVKCKYVPFWSRTPPEPPKNPQP